LLFRDSQIDNLIKETVANRRRYQHDFTKITWNTLLIDVVVTVGTEVYVIGVVASPLYSAVYKSF